jgi:hypothetical protein
MPSASILLNSTWGNCTTTTQSPKVILLQLIIRVEVLKRFNEAIVLTNTPWAILSDDKFPVIEEARKQAIEAQDRERALAGAHVGTPSVCQLPSCPSVKIDPQTQDAESVEFCLKLLYQTYGY